MSTTSTESQAMAEPTGELENDKVQPTKTGSAHSAFHSPRYFPQTQCVYTVISPRAKGLTIGVNLNADRYCNFNCVYCEVAGDKPSHATPCDVDATAAALESVLGMAMDGSLSHLPCYQNVPPELMQLREVTLSGDGEPTLCPNFSEVVAAVVRIRAVGHFPFFKIVLVTNSSGLLHPEVQEGLRLFTHRDEIWAKLDAGTDHWLHRINQTELSLQQIMHNISTVGKMRPIVIQSLFPLYKNTPPPREEIEAYIHRLQELKAAGASIQLVQIYSAHRPNAHPDCGHLPLRILSQIARDVREKTGLPAEVF